RGPTGRAGRGRGRPNATRGRFIEPSPRASGAEGGTRPGRSCPIHRVREVAPSAAFWRSEFLFPPWKPTLSATFVRSLLEDRGHIPHAPGNPRHPGHPAEKRSRERIDWTGRAEVYYE